MWFVAKAVEIFKDLAEVIIKDWKILYGYLMYVENLAIKQSEVIIKDWKEKALSIAKSCGCIWVRRSNYKRLKDKRLYKYIDKYRLGALKRSNYKRLKVIIS